MNIRSLSFLAALLIGLAGALAGVAAAQSNDTSSGSPTSAGDSTQMIQGDDSSSRHSDDYDDDSGRDDDHDGDDDHGNHDDGDHDGDDDHGGRGDRDGGDDHGGDSGGRDD